MPLRLLEITVPKDELEQIPKLLEDVRTVQIWTSETSDETGNVSILLDAKDTEAATDVLVDRFESNDGFRVVLLPVEATFPTVEQPSEDDVERGERSESKSTTARRISREELYEDIAQASKLTQTYVIMVALSTVVAAVGLIRGDVAIVIGAMVIAPLLGPNIGLSLASTLGDLDLAKRSLKAIGAGVFTAAAVSLLLGFALTIDPYGPEITGRTRAGLGDVALALAAGAAGSLAFTSGVPAIVVGVMVAVALLPPLVVAGLLAGSGHGKLAFGAFILVLTNVTCVNLAAVGTFLIRKVRPRTWWEADRAKKATWIAAATWIIMLGIMVTLILAGLLETDEGVR